jgi:hypothetical protein
MNTNAKTMLAVIIVAIVLIPIMYPLNVSAIYSIEIISFLYPVSFLVFIEFCVCCSVECYPFVVTFIVRL